MTNQETHYQTRLVGNGLNESPASYDTLRKWCDNPQWTLKELAANTGRKYKKILEWSSKYHYTSRKQAYLENIHNELHQEVMALKKKQLTHYIEQEDEEQAIIEDDQYITRQLQKQIKNNIDMDITPDKDETNIYLSFKDSYTKHRKDHATTTQTIIHTTIQDMNLDEIDQNKLSDGANKLLNQIQQLRKEQGRRK